MVDVPLRTDPPSAEKPTGRKSWQESIGQWAFQLTVLKVVTYVGDASIVSTTDGVPDRITVAAGGAAFVTVCDLIGGDITNVIPPQYKDDEGLRAFHTQQVATAGAVLPSNLRVLAELADRLFK